MGGLRNAEREGTQRNIPTVFHLSLLRRAEKTRTSIGLYASLTNGISTPGLQNNIRKKNRKAGGAKSSRGVRVSSPPGGLFSGRIAEPSGRGVRGGCCERRRLGTSREHQRTRHTVMCQIVTRKTLAYPSPATMFVCFFALASGMSSRTWPYGGHGVPAGNVCQYQGSNQKMTDYCRIA